MDERSATPERRRFFLTLLLGVLGAILAAVAAWPLFRFLSPRKQGEAASKITFPRAKVPVGGAHFFQYQGHPAVVIQPKAGHFIALTAVCTHLGCIVKWEKDQNDFLCPCHGGRYTPEGKVIAGPPPRPLETYAVSVQGDEIVVG